MLPSEENERLVRVGPGTPMGDVWRRYWIPCLLSEELPEPDCPPVRVRLLGEDLVAFRDTGGTVGVVEAFCPHRRAPMFFGRNEENGLRCVYHGWKFNRAGTCVDMPSEPPDSLFRTKVAIAAYPTHEAAGIVWVYMGPAALTPPVPDYELLRAPATHRFVSKTYEECNWLQALEGGVDTAHISFAHNWDIQHPFLNTIDTAPRVIVEKTPYGYWYAGVRNAPGGEYVRLYHYFMPAQQCRPASMMRGRADHIPAIEGHIWVPIDDEHTWSWNWAYSNDPDVPLPRAYALEHIERWNGRHPTDDVGRGYRPKRNKRNDYMIDRNVQKTQTYTGINGVNTQDFALQEGMGPIVDRSKEHLGSTDRAIIATRQLLSEAIDEVAAGRMPRGTDPEAYRGLRATEAVVPPGERWQDALRPETVAKY